jgi:hypothetical protein
MLRSHRHVLAFTGAEHGTHSPTILRQFTGGPLAWANVIRTWYERSRQAIVVCRQGMTSWLAGSANHITRRQCIERVTFAVPLLQWATLSSAAGIVRLNWRTRHRPVRQNTQQSPA